MPRAIPVPVWQAILQRRQQGHSLNSIAQEFDISIMTVRSLSRRLRDRGPEALTPDYARCAPPRP
jgi:transposase